MTVHYSPPVGTKVNFSWEEEESYTRPFGRNVNLSWYPLKWRIDWDSTGNDYSILVYWDFQDEASSYRATLWFEDEVIQTTSTEELKVLWSGFTDVLVYRLVLEVLDDAGNVIEVFETSVISYLSKLRKLFGYYGTYAVYRLYLGNVRIRRLMLGDTPTS